MKRQMFNLKKQILGACWLFILVVVLLLITLLWSLIVSYQEKNRDRHMDELSVYLECLEQDYSQLHRTVEEIYMDNADFSGIGYYPSKAERWSRLYNLMKVLKIQATVNKGISGLFVYYDAWEHMQYAVDESISFQALKTLKEQGRSILQISDTISANYTCEADGELWYNLFFKKNNAAIGGCVRLDQGLPVEKAEGAIYGVYLKGKFYQIWPAAGEGESFFSADIEEGENRREKDFIYFRRSVNTDLAVAEILPKSYNLYVNNLHLALFCLILLFILASGKILRLVYRELYVPLQNMTNTLKNIKEGQWTVDFTAPNRISEIEDVRQSVKLLLAEVEHYKIRFYEEELEKARIHRQYLQMQLAPHFYTNCLKNAYYMLALKEYDQAEVFLQRLSVHLRYLLQQRGFVSLQEELDFVENYVDLQKLMTSKPLTCEIDADKEAMDKLIPIIAIQTFVENSVKYARENDGSLLKIKITVRYRKTEEGNYLDITVRDNGAGYPENLLKVLNEGKPVTEGREGIGVRNLLERLRVVYQEKDRPSWYFENQHGAVSELLLPEKYDIQEASEDA